MLHPILPARGIIKDATVEQVPGGAFESPVSTGRAASEGSGPDRHQGHFERTGRDAPTPDPPERSLRRYLNPLSDGDPGSQYDSGGRESYRFFPSGRHRMHAGLRMIHSLALVLSLVLALTWNGTSAFSSVCRVVCLFAIVGYLVYVLFAFFRESLSEPTGPTKRPTLLDLWDRDLNGPGPI